MPRPLSTPDDDVVRQLLEPPSSTVRRLRFRHWFGIVSLVLAVGAVSVLVPPLITGSAEAPTPVESSTWSSSAPASRPGASVAAATLPDRPAPTRPTAGRPARPSTSPPEPAPITAPFRTVVVQAENGRLSDGAATTDCPSCGGSSRVRYVGRVEVELNVPAAGRRTVTVAYTVNGHRRLSVAVNGVVVMSRRPVSGTSWEEPRRISVRAAVPAGRVTIAVYGANEAPDVDAVTLSRFRGPSVTPCDGRAQVTSTRSPPRRRTFAHANID